VGQLLVVDTINHPGAGAQMSHIRILAVIISLGGSERNGPVVIPCFSIKLYSSRRCINNDH